MEDSTLAKQIAQIAEVPEHLLSKQLYHTLRGLIPRPDVQETLTWSKVPHSLSYFIPFLILAYLARRANTHLVRLLILPTALASIIYCTYRYKVEDPRYYVWGCIRTLIAHHIMAQSMDFAFSREGRFKLDEESLPRVGSGSIIPLLPVPTRPATSHKPKRSSRTDTWLLSGLADAVELSISLRGIGWDFGAGLHLPNRKPQQRSAFLRETAVTCIKNFLIVDFCDSLLKFIPGAGSVGGSSIFFPELPIPMRYVVSTAIHTICGVMILCGLSAGYDAICLGAVGLCKQSPNDWPPLFDRPWRSCSLHDFWGKGWHQILRRTFIILGGYPGYQLAGKAGLVLGTFLASGVYHELGLQSSDHRITLFFGLQGVGVLLEHVWKRITGRKVGGFLGWVWMAFNVFVLGQMFLDAWAVGGMCGSVLVPRQLSPFRQVVFPLVQAAAVRVMLL